jgi:hypothetical protein
VATAQSDDDRSDVTGKGPVLPINPGAVTVTTTIKRESKPSEDLQDDEEDGLPMDFAAEGGYRGYTCRESRRMSLNSGGVGLRVDGMAGGNKTTITAGLAPNRGS